MIIPFPGVISIDITVETGCVEVGVAYHTTNT